MPNLASPNSPTFNVPKLTQLQNSKAHFTYTQLIFNQFAPFKSKNHLTNINFTFLGKCKITEQCLEFRKILEKLNNLELNVSDILNTFTRCAMQLEFLATFLMKRCFCQQVKSRDSKQCLQIIKNVSFEFSRQK